MKSRMSSQEWTVGVIALTLVLFVSCAQATTAPATTPTSSSPGSTVNPAWQVEWEKTLVEAKKEREVHVFNSGGPEAIAALRDPFKAKFGIDLVYVAGTSSEIGARLTTEKRAGAPWGDLVLMGPGTVMVTIKPTGALAPIKPLLLLPEVLDAKAYFDDRFPFIDNEGQYTISHAPGVQLPIIINSESVKRGEVKGYADLLNAKWKGQIVTDDPSASGAASTVFYMTAYHLMNLDYQRQLVKQEPMITRDARQLVEWVAKGKYPIGIGPGREIVGQFQMAGAPLEWVYPIEGEYLGSGAIGTISYVDKAPDPNAAKIFTNWFLTKEALTIFSKAALVQTVRKDVPTDFLKQEGVRRPNVKYFNADEEKIRIEQVASMTVAKEIYAPLLK